ncbi:MAG: hypothetical protein U5L95_01750 [Candidatus Saccharibacteria bacterium]|nr:hypothetical protein [Candidatus Saccharibacteria bacterium]
MKMVILYHPVSEQARKVEEFARDFERTQHVKPELVSLETKEGADLARVYDAVQYPAIIVTRDDGSHMKQWEGEKLPLMDEVAARLR